MIKDEVVIITGASSGIGEATGRLNHAQIKENTLTMGSLGARVGDQRPFEIHHRRARGRRVPRALGVLLGVLVPGGCQAGRLRRRARPRPLPWMPQRQPRHRRRNHACG